MRPQNPKILFVCTEDWFFKSHFMPLSRAAHEKMQFDVALVTTIGNACKDIERTGTRVIGLDFQRSSKNVFSAIIILWRLVSILKRERPDIVHFLALKPILLGGLATLFLPNVATVFHLTGLGYLAESKSKLATIVRTASFWLITTFLKRRKSWLIVENPDDLAFVEKFGKIDQTRTSQFGGAGVDPDYYFEQPETKNNPLHITYVGRMIWSKGIDVLVEAMNELGSRNVDLVLDMYGEPDLNNPRAIQAKTLNKWNKLPNINWHGTTLDVREVWKNSDIGVMATRTREGMPRAMLEAASSGRALIVTDIPGCRHFVREGIEGILVRPDDHLALAEAMEKLVRRPELRRKMGKAARRRVLEAYTENHAQTELMNIYQTTIKMPDA